MKSNKNRKPSNSIKNLSSALQCASLSTFLIVGLNGCSSDSECSKLNNLSQKKIDECKNQTSSGFSSSHSSGFFAPISGSTVHSSSSSKSSHFGG